MSNELLKKLYTYGVIVHFKKDEIIVHEGDALDSIYVIVKGKAKVLPSSINGVESLIDYLEKDDFIGDLEYSKKSPHLHSVVACEDIDALLLPIENMNILLNDIIFCRYYILNLTKKLNLTSKKSTELNTLSAKERFLHYLEVETENNIYKIKNTFEELASKLGMSSRHLRRVINELKEENIIEVNQKTITIKRG